MGRRREELTVRPRSVIPGRQRWDIGVVLGRPCVAESLEVALQESPGVRQARANPVTGRLLVYHDSALSSAEVDQLVRQAVPAVQQAMTVTRSSEPEPSVVPGREQPEHRTALSLALVGSAAAALALIQGKSVPPSLMVNPSPVVRLGAVLLATVGVVRHAWRRSSGSQHASAVPLAVPLRTIRHPLLHIVGSRRRQFYLASFLSILAQLFEMALFLLVGWMLSVLTTGSSASLVGLGLASASGQLWFLAGVAALVCVATAALSFKAGVLWRDLAQSVQHGWRTEMYAHVQRVELRYLEGERTTRLARVLTEDINQLGRFFATSANNLLQLASSFLVLIPVFLVFAPSIAWIAFLPVPIIAWLSFFNQERAAPDYATSSESGSLLNSQLINNLEASTTVKSFGAEEYEIDRIRRLSEAYRLSNRRIDTRASAYGQTVRGCAMLSLVGILLAGGLDVLTGALSFENFNGLIGVPSLVLWKLPAFGEAVDQYQQTVAALRRVLDVRSLPVESGTTGQRLDVAKVKGEMVLDEVTFAYPGRPPVLQNLSLRIAARKTTGIVGVTGAGKTTIAKLLLRFQDVESGRVLVDGRDVREVRLQDLRNAIGFVGQDAFLFDGTVGDNIRYGSFDADAARVVSAARLAEADGFVAALPSQYDTMIGERGATLSGGQKQRISLARAILKSAPIVILDEATSALDNETEEAIQRALRDYARDRTLVIIAHHLSTIRHADWIYVMDQGGVIAEGGTHQELLARDGVYAYLWRLQTGEVNNS
jgi:ATP-binding cassette, subfamily B, bacterial